MSQDWFDALPTSGVTGDKKEKEKDWFSSLPTSSVVGQEEKDWFYSMPTTEVVGGDMELMPSHDPPKKPPVPLALSAAEGIKSGYESVIGPMEGAMEIGTDIFNFLSSIAVTIGASAPWGEGDWERGGEIGGKYSQFIENLYNPKTDFGKQSVAPIDAFFDKVGEAMLYTGEDVLELEGDDLVKFETAVGIGFIALGSRLHGKAKATFKNVAGKAKTLRPLKIMLERSNRISDKVKTVIEKIPDETPIAPEIQKVVKKAKPSIALSKKQAEAFRKMPDDVVRKMADKGVEGAKIEIVERKVAAKQMDLPIEQPKLQKDVKLPQPEAGSLAYGMELPQKVGNIRIDKLNSSYEIKKSLADVAATYRGQAKKKSRGTVPWKETEKAAREMGTTVEGLMKSRKGKAFNAAELESARMHMGAAIEDLVAKQKKYLENPGDEALINVRASIERAGGIMTTVSAAKSEAGRALNILRKEYQPGEMKYQAMERILRELGGRAKNQELIMKMANLDWGDPLAINKFIRQVTKTKFSDKVFELWVNNLLSGLPTHIVNSVSTAAMTLEKPLVTAGAALLESPKRLAGKKPSVYWGEVPAEAFSLKHGLQAGVNKAAFAMANEMTMGGASKLEVRTPTAIKGIKGQAVRLPGRFLITEDEFFKAIIHQADIEGIAYNLATKEGLRGKARNNRIADLITDPTVKMMEHATGEMLGRSFQKELGKYGRSISGIRTSVPGLRYLVPFLRVTLNIPKEALRRTPLNLPRIIIKSAKGTLKGEKLSREMAMAGIGTLTSMAVFKYAMDGQITGGAPVEKSERDAFYREGKSPYSIKIGDKWYSYARIEPLATIFGIAADAEDVFKQASEENKDELAKKIIGMVTENLSNKTFMRGLSDAMRAISDPERWGDYFIESLTGTVVPTGVSYLSKAMDDTRRDARGIIDNIKSRVPELSKTLPAQRDIWGREKTREGGALFQMVSPVWVTTEDVSMVDQELQRLKLFIGAPSRKVGERELDKNEYSDMMKDVGEELYKTLHRIISLPSYKAIKDDEAKKKIVRTITSAMRRKGREKYKDIGIVIE